MRRRNIPKVPIPKKFDYQSDSTSPEVEALATARYAWLVKTDPDKASKVRRLIRSDGTLVINETTATVHDLDKFAVPKNFDELGAIV